MDALLERSTLSLTLLRCFSEPEPGSNVAVDAGNVLRGVGVLPGG